MMERKTGQCNETAEANSHPKMLEADELRTFLLAACMVDLFIHMNTRNKAGIANIVSRVDQLLKQDMTFTTRFKKAMAAIYKPTSPSQEATPDVT